METKSKKETTPKQTEKAGVIKPKSNAASGLTALFLL